MARALCRSAALPLQPRPPLCSALAALTRRRSRRPAMLVELSVNAFEMGAPSTAAMRAWLYAQPLAPPARKGRGFGLGDIHRPGSRLRN